jgi:hypothetical protein
MVALIKGLRQIYLCKAKMHLQMGLKKKKTQKGVLHWKSRPPVSIGFNRVEMLVLLLPHGK